MTKKKEKAIEEVEAVKAVEASPIAEQVFSKPALVASNEFLRYRDLLKVLLNDGEMYSVSETRNKINAYLYGEV